MQIAIDPSSLSEINRATQVKKGTQSLMGLLAAVTDRRYLSIWNLLIVGRLTNYKRSDGPPAI